MKFGCGLFQTYHSNNLIEAWVSLHQVPSQSPPTKRQMQNAPFIQVGLVLSQSIEWPLRLEPTAATVGGRFNKCGKLL